MHTRWPRAEDLAFEPELAPLTLLDAAAAIAVQSLIARNPELLSHSESLRHAPRAAAARHLVALYCEMHDALDEYRDLLTPAYPAASGTDEIPF